MTSDRIRRRDFLSLALAPAAGNTRPNIVIILADDLGAADLGYRGSEIRTPHIDRLARDGVRMERFYACPLCSPTRAALMTARYPVRYGILYDVIKSFSGHGLPAEEHLMPESFRAAGYQTAIVGKWHLGHARRRFLPNARGFDHAYGHLNGAIDYYTHQADGGLDWNRNGKSLRENGYSTDLLAAEAVRVIRNRDRARPLFLYLPFNAPHGPLQAPEGIVAKYQNIKNGARRTYAAMVDSLDAAVGQVLSVIDEQRMRDQTLVLFFSDNGGLTPGGALNTPFRGFKATTFEGGIRVPAILRWPGRLGAGTRLDQVMTAMDVFPTLAAAAGVPTRNRLPLDGKSLWTAILHGKEEPREDLFFGVESRLGLRLALLRREWKFVRDGEANYLFQIEEDPTESRDRSDERPALVREMAELCEKWRAAYPAGGTHASDAAPPGWQAPLEWAEAAQ